MDPQKAKLYHVVPVVKNYTTRDAIIYALGIGATVKDDLHFLYENHENFQVFPTFVVNPGLTSMSLDGVPGIAYNLQNILHGEQYIELFEPIPEEGQFRTEVKVVDILDKGSAAVILSDVTTYDNLSGKKLALQQFATFQLKSGNFGGNRSNPEEKKALPVPQRSPDRILEEKTTQDQAALYRYGSGDMNPLHVDPNFARSAGFKQPILHGLCTLGVSTKAILRQFGHNDATRLHRVKVRFSAPVIPGQTLLVECWQEGNRIHFQTKVKETGQIVISNGYVDLKNHPSAITSKNSNEELKSDLIFRQINDQIPSQTGIVKKVQSIVLYDIQKNGKHAAFFTLDLKNGNGSAFRGEPKDKPTVTVTIDDDDFLKIVTGELSGMKAFMSGKLKARGNVLILQKLQSVLSGATKSKL